MKHWATIPNPKQRALVRAYVETNDDMATCAKNAGYHGNNLKQVANAAIRRLREQGYSIPYRVDPTGQKASETPIEVMRSGVRECIVALERDPDVIAVARRLRQIIA